MSAPGTPFAPSEGMRLPRAYAAAGLGMLILAGACRNNGEMARVSAAIQQIASAQTPKAAAGSVWADVRAFYEAREHEPVWVTHKPVPRRIAEALRVLQSAQAHGLDPGRYDEPAFVEMRDALSKLQSDAPDRAERLAAFDVRLTGALLQLGHDAALGRTPPGRIDRRWKSRRTPPDLAATLARAIDTDLDGWLGTIVPKHPEYAALQKALASLYAEQEQGGAGSPTTGKDQIPVDRRIRQVELNLDRWRWMPDDLGARHLLVNIPSYHLYIRENGHVVKDIRVVVGKPGNETPIFSSDMKTVVFSPFWNIPDTIAAGETAPAIARDPDYLRRNNIEILRLSGSGATMVDPDDVDWNDPELLQELAFRQRPGPGNALGHVKFQFPNSYNVYLHDTPADRLFERPGRAFSHGCVRVEEPEALAEYVLRGDPNWPRERIAEAMHSGIEKHVKLPQPLPVHLVYLTAWVEASGEVRFLPDIYGHDARQAGPLARR